jgi:leucine dehydrogenase
MSHSCVGVNEFQATPVAPDDIYASDADIFAPCAFGGVVNETTIPPTQG